MTKNTILSKAIAAAASLAIVSTAAHAATATNNGIDELFIAVHATGGVGSGKSVVIDAGSVVSLSALTVGSTQSLGSIGTDLAATFGSNWYNRSDVLWSAVAAVQSTTISGGDPTSTLYGGVAATGSYPLSTTAYSRGTNSGQNPVAQRILSNAITGIGGFTSAGTGASSNIAVEQAGEANNYATWMPGGTNTSLFGGFGGQTTFEQSFAAGTLASGYEGALDVYRMIKTGTGDADLGGATTGPGSYQFTVTVDSSGNLTAQDLPVTPVPEPASLGSLFSAALLGIGALRRKRGAKA